MDGSTTRHVLGKLIEGNEYQLRVYAENKIGAGPPAELSQSITAKLPYGPPGAPTGLEVEDVTTRSCVLKWKAPEFDGGSPVTGYYVESSQRSYSTRWSKVNRTAVRQPRLEIKDLVELTEYVFRVTAENDVGLGKPSEPSDVVIPVSVQQDVAAGPAAGRRGAQGLGDAELGAAEGHRKLAHHQLRRGDAPGGRVSVDRRKPAQDRDAAVVHGHRTQGHTVRVPCLGREQGRPERPV